MALYKKITLLFTAFTYFLIIGIHRNFEKCNQIILQGAMQFVSSSDEKKCH